MAVDVVKVGNGKGEATDDDGGCKNGDSVFSEGA